MPGHRHQAIDDASAWIAWLIAYRAELNRQLPQDVPRRAALERGRPERKPRP